MPTALNGTASAANRTAATVNGPIDGESGDAVDLNTPFQTLLNELTTLKQNGMEPASWTLMTLTSPWTNASAAGVPRGSYRLEAAAKRVHLCGYVEAVGLTGSDDFIWTAPSATKPSWTGHTFFLVPCIRYVISTTTTTYGYMLLWFSESAGDRKLSPLNFNGSAYGTGADYRYTLFLDGLSYSLDGNT